MVPLHVLWYGERLHSYVVNKLQSLNTSPIVANEMAELNYADSFFSFGYILIYLRSFVNLLGYNAGDGAAMCASILSQPAISLS